MFSLPASVALAIDPALPSFSNFPASARVLHWDRDSVREYARAMAAASVSAGPQLRVLTDTAGLPVRGPRGRLLHYVGVVDPFWAIYAPATASTISECYRRASDPRFWARRGRQKLGIGKEQVEKRAGLISKHAPHQYSGPSADVLCSAADVATAAFIEKNVVYDADTGLSFSLADVVKTPAEVFARHYAVVKALETLAADRPWAMLTLTATPEWHASPATAKPGHSWNGLDAKAANQEIGRLWNKVTAILAKSGVRLAGIRTEEPMQDGTPHWHIVFSYRDAAALPLIQRAVLRTFSGGLRTKGPVFDAAGKLVFDAAGKLVMSSVLHKTLVDFDCKTTTPSRFGARAQLDLGALSVDLPLGLFPDCGPLEVGKSFKSPISRLSSYAMKYAMKHLAVEQVSTSGEFEEGEQISESGSSQQVQFHRRTYGIRGLQFFGLPRGALTAWGLLRQVDLAPSAMLPASSGIRYLAELCQLDGGAGMAPFIEQLGGLLPHVKTRYKLVLSALTVDASTRYGASSERVLGLTLGSSGSATTENFIIKSGSKSIMSLVDADARRVALETAKFGVSTVSRTSPAAGAGLVQLDITQTLHSAYKFSVEQLAAIQAPVSLSITISAAAASGKTSVLVARVLHLRESGIPASDIALTTFTVKAANELKARLPASCAGVQVGTMHSLSAQWLTASDAAAYLAATGADEITQDNVIAASLAYAKPTKYLLLDEAQDCTPEQWNWAHAHAKTLYAVGDDRQSLYDWRGAAAGGMLTQAELSTSAAWDAHAFDLDLVDRLAAPAPSGVYHLSTNFRSASEIVALGNSIMSGTVPSVAITAGGQVQVGVYENPENELGGLVEYLSSAKGTRAVVCRTVSQVLRIKSYLETLPELVNVAGIDVLTVHAAKGLEFDSVAFATGVRSDLETVADLSRALYVAVTRAKTSLFISSVGVLLPLLSAAISSAYSSKLD